MENEKTTPWEIVNTARDCGLHYRCFKDPFKLAEALGFPVRFINAQVKTFKARVFHSPFQAVPVIEINHNVSEISQKFLCAHEIGHDILHPGANTYDITRKNMNTSLEYEANLFAVGFMCPLDKEFDKPVYEMDSFELHRIIEDNIH